MQRLGAALALCLEHLKGFRGASSPPAVLVVSGPLLSRLRASLAEVGVALQDLGAGMGPASLHGAALSLCGTQLAALPLPGLELRASQAAELSSWLEEASRRPGGLEAPDTHADAWRMIRGALESAGVPKATLEDAEARTRIAQDLYDLSDVVPPLTSEEVQASQTLAAYLMPPPPASGGPSQSTTPTAFLCAITKELMRDPEVNALGLTHEREHIEAWLQNHDTDPQEQAGASGGGPYIDAAAASDPSGAAVGDPSGAAVGDPSGAAVGDPSGAAVGDPSGAVVGDPSGATIRVLDYVTAAPCYRTVRALHAPYDTWWYDRAALQRVPSHQVPPDQRLEVPPQPPGSGVPVLPFTAKTGLLVRRGYDWLNASDRNGLGGETGMLIRPTEDSPRGTGTRWLVFWAKGGEGTYSLGHGNKFELQHLQFKYPQRAGGQDDGGEGRGGADVWGNETWTDFNGSHVVRRGEPVTAETAQANMPVMRGITDGKWICSCGEGMVGELLRPEKLEGDKGVWWRVRWADGISNFRYRVGRRGVHGWSDLQVAMYERDREAGEMVPWTPVELVQDVQDGPLRPGGDCALVLERNLTRVKVRGWEAVMGIARTGLHIATGTEWWYDRAALRPIPPSLAVDRNRWRLRLNREGRVAFRGRPGRSGGHTGRPAGRVYYCGAEGRQYRCGGCVDGRCGPLGGCPCAACAEMPVERRAPVVMAVAGVAAAGLAVVAKRATPPQWCSAPSSDPSSAPSSPSSSAPSLALSSELDIVAAVDCIFGTGPGSCLHQAMTEAVLELGLGLEVGEGAFTAMSAHLASAYP
ncbi:hypothetical protein HYH03_016235 [Edaphochlamys debaryana]|uniref:U-box domain-containing protein n=1 Tax=Edaphochlamys debaryana TaxID=47281 RepID=A0A835XKR9_9CHLO|nr:hypothetical protein HYH03_016235 [Edaphochlamys debaryana]|eukprot:KAG2485032.1 hypothetical protein HYH03_016235 [Edaphochlamys debaryana]